VGQPPGLVTRNQVGTALSVGENRATGKHTHEEAYAVSTGKAFGGTQGWTVSTGNTKQSGNVNPTGAGVTTEIGTNAPYVQYLMCIKL
jgi:hypothetical protein